MPISPGLGASTRRMTALLTPEFQEPDSWWVTPDADYGMDMLVGEFSKYDCRKAPIVTLGSTFLVVEEDGGTSWGGRIPKELDDKLRGRRKTLPKVDLVSLSTDDKSYFVSFEDGTAQWQGLPSYLAGFIQGSPKIKVLALGPDMSYYCRNTDGRDIYEGLPEGLQDALVGRKNSLPKVSNVNLGPKGAWFVAFEDGSWLAGNVPGSCKKRIQNLKENREPIREILFGVAHTWMIRFDYKK